LAPFQSIHPTTNNTMNSNTPQWAKELASLIAFVYTAGWYCGTLLHRANDWLAGKRPVRTASPTVEWALRAEAAPSVALAPPTGLEALTVVQLRQVARAAGIRQAGGRRIAQATKASLLTEIRRK
jgi:hypothetical protein